MRIEEIYNTPWGGGKILPPSYKVESETRLGGGGERGSPLFQPRVEKLILTVRMRRAYGGDSPGDS